MSDRLQDKMYNYEVTPPGKVWEKIASSLDESEMTHEFPSKLRDIEIIPPSTAWNKIEASLDAESETIPIRKHRKIYYVRYAVAASIIGLIVFGTIQLIKGKTSGKVIAKEKKEPSQKDNVMPLAAQNSPEPKTQMTTEEQRDNQALEESKKTYAKLDFPPRKKTKIISDYTKSTIDEEEIFNQLHYADAIHAGLLQADTKNLVASRYMTLLTPDGNYIRMSKKLSDLACCVSGEEQDQDCKNQLQQWRDKIACSSVAPAPGNFMDIVSLLNTLKETGD